VINENEVSHSKYADTLNTLKSAIDECNDNGRKGNSYHFITFDKFNIHTLFASGENNIINFDAVIIATNALHNIKVYEMFCKNKQSVENFINANKGIFISPQRKLNNHLTTNNAKSTGFLPDLYDYYLIFRPDNEDSNEGTINIVTDNEDCRVLSYPYAITNDIIRQHCEQNNFKQHKYKSFIIPKHIYSFDTLLYDNTSNSLVSNELGCHDNRKVLLSSRHNKRIIISSMVLDWANHKEMLCNILTHITEDKPLTIFVKKQIEQHENSIIDSYRIRANTSNLPYRVILENEIENYKKMSGNVLVFSSKWTTQEVENIYNSKLANVSTYFSLYHISNTDNPSSNIKLCKYSNFSSIDTMKDAVIREIIGGYQSNQWNKSVWSYSYIINLIDFFNISVPHIVDKVYLELSKHFTKVNSRNNLIGNYDGVFNATCKMLEILHCFQSRYDNILFASPYQINDVIQLANKWLQEKINTESVFDHDVCYYLMYLLKNEKYHDLQDTIQQKLLQLFKNLLADITRESFISEIENRSNIDLCRIYQTLCLLIKQGFYTGKEKEENEKYIERLESIFKQRQDIYGNWKNLSETSEITATLLETYDLRKGINQSLDTVNTLIIRGIEVLHSQFNPKSNMWSDDLNTTAKAMYAIGMYDKIFNFAVNDFFLDLSNHETKAKSTEETKIEKIDTLYQTIDELNNKEKTLNKTIQSDKDYRKFITGFAFCLLAVSLSLLFILTVLFAILFIKHRDILFDILSSWTIYFVAGFFSLVVASIGTTIYKYLRKTIK